MRREQTAGSIRGAKGPREARDSRNPYTSVAPAMQSAVTLASRAPLVTRSLARGNAAQHPLVRAERGLHHHHPMSSAQPRSAPTVVEAVERAYGAGQRLVVDRIDLLTLQATETWERLVRRGKSAAIGVALAGLGWLCLVGALLSWLSAVWSWPSALALVGTLHVAGGGAFLASTRARPAPTPEGA